MVQVLSNQPSREDFVKAGARDRIQMLLTELDRLPERQDFLWHFGDVLTPTSQVQGPECGAAGCALGVGRWLWSTVQYEADNRAESLGYETDYCLEAAVDELCSITLGEGLVPHDWVFYNHIFYGKNSMAEVTPGDVADALRRLLATGDPRTPEQVARGWGLGDDLFDSDVGDEGFEAGLAGDHA
jgi:hypothetical protein